MTERRGECGRWSERLPRRSNTDRAHIEGRNKFGYPDTPGKAGLMKTTNEGNMSDITVNSIVSCNKEILAANMDSEIVMMRVETGKYYSLGKMGSVIWSMLESPVSVQSIVDTLLDKYQIERDQCEKEVLAFLNQASQEGLLKLE
jgi:hypothetical protein